MPNLIAYVFLISLIVITTVLLLLSNGQFSNWKWKDFAIILIFSGVSSFIACLSYLLLDK